MLPAYSPLEEAAKPIGMKPAMVTSVPDSMGPAVAPQAKVAAAIRSSPSSIFTTIISMAMIASSTSRPSARISAPSVMRSKSRPVISMMTKTAPSVRGTDSATTTPTRAPSATNETIITTPSASTNLVMNSL